MKRSFVSLLTMAAIVFGMASCNSSKKQEEAAKTEQEAVIAGEVSKDLLTDELKLEVSQFLKDMPDSDLAYKLSTGEVSVSVANTNFMLPVSKASELNTQTQKARATGVYFADLSILRAMNKPTTEVENALVKLTTDLNIPFAIDIMKESAPANATKEQVNAFLNKQEDRLIDAMAQNDRMDVLVELLGGAAVEYAYLLGNPGLVIKGDAVSAGLSENMINRVNTLSQVVSDLSNYYPDMVQLGQTISSLPEKIESVATARASQAEIKGMRDTLLN